MGAFQPHGGTFTRTAVSLASPSERTDLREISDVNAREGLALAAEFDEPDAQQTALAAELMDVQTLVSVDGQAFSGLWLNRHAPNGATPRPLLLVANGFLTDVTQTDAKFRAYFMAREFPDAHVLYYDQPGHGLSSPYSRSQRRGMWHGNMQDVGRQQASAVERFVDSSIGPVASVELKAESLGSRQSLEVALALQEGSIPVAAMTLLELPGTEDGRLVGIHGSYFGYEFLRASYYNADWLQPVIHGSFKDFLRTYSGQPDREPAASFFRRDRRMAVENFLHSTLGHGTGLQSLRSLVADGMEIVRVTGQKSRIDRLAVAEAQRRSFQADLGRTFGQVNLVHESHDGTGTASRARLAARLARFTLDHTEQLIRMEDTYLTTMRRIQAGVLLSPDESRL